MDEEDQRLLKGSLRRRSTPTEVGDRFPLRRVIDRYKNGTLLYAEVDLAGGTLTFRYLLLGILGRQDRMVPRLSGAR